MRFSIQSKILVLSLSCTLIGTLSLGILSTLFIGRTTQRNSIQYMKDQANATAANLNFMLESHEKYTMGIVAGVYSQLNADSTILTNDKKFHVTLDGIQKSITSTILNLSNTKSVYVRFNPDLVHSNDGVFLVRDTPEGPFKPHVTTNITQYTPTDFDRVGWYYKPITTGAPLWISPYYNKNINSYITSYVVPMFMNNKEIGVAGIDIDFENLTKQLSQVRFMKTGFAYLEDAEGSIVYHPTLPTGLTFKPEDDQVQFSVRLYNGMTLAAVVPAIEINAQRDKHIKHIILFICALLTITTTITIIFARSITKPLKQLTKEAKRMITGDIF